MTSFQQCLDLIKQRYGEAEQRLDFDEAIRPLNLLAETCHDQIQKLRAAQESKSS